MVWKHADDVSAVSDVEQGLYSSQGNMSAPTTEGTDAPQTNVSSASKGSNNSANVQENEQENAEKENKKTTEESLKQFIDDWEKDHENATKVVDDKGLPIVVYRGGGRLGNIEDASNNAKYGKAYYATPSRYGAEEFAEERTGDKNNVLGGVH